MRSPLLVPVLCALWLSSAGCGASPIGAIFSSLDGAKHFARGTQALESGRPQEAVRDLERAAILVPHASEIQNHLGLAYWAEGQESEARLAFERALELDCENVAARTNQAQLEAALGARDEGAEAGDE